MAVLENLIEQDVRCILCGGEAIADTEEHLPPKILFTDKHWPEGYVFPACKACNSDSREQDRIIGLLARFTDRSEEDGHMEKLLGAISKRNAEFLRKMMNMTRAEKRAAARKAGIRPEPGELWQDIPLVLIPTEVHYSVEVLAAKLTKALHFKHTGKIVPSDAAIWFRWMTNAHRLGGETLLPEPLPFKFDLKPTLVRNQKELRDQFDYEGSISPDGEIAVYACGFGNVFAFLTILTFDPSIQENIIEKAKTVTGRKQGGLKRIYWPIPD